MTDEFFKIGFAVLFLKEIIVNIVKYIFNVEAHKVTKLSEYKLKRYDEFVEKIEAMLSGDINERKMAKRTLNTLWGKILLSAPDKIVRKLIKETKGEFNKKQRNRLYFVMRKELQPGTNLKIEEIENIYFTVE